MNHVTYPLSFADSSIFFAKTIASLVLSENTDKHYVVISFSHSFDFNWVLKSCFNQDDCNFKNGSRIGYSRRH